MTKAAGFTEFAVRNAVDGERVEVTAGAWNGPVAGTTTAAAPPAAGSVPYRRSQAKPTAGTVADAAGRMFAAAAGAAWGECHKQQAAAYLLAAERSDVEAMIDACVRFLAGEPDGVYDGVRRWNVAGSLSASLACLPFLTDAGVLTRRQAAEAEFPGGDGYRYGVRDVRGVRFSPWLVAGDRVLASDGREEVRLLRAGEIEAVLLGEQATPVVGGDVPAAMRSIMRSAGSPFGRLLAGVRREAGMPVVDLAARLSRLGLPTAPAKVLWWEQGNYTPGPADVVALRDVFGSRLTRAAVAFGRAESARSARSAGSAASDAAAEGVAAGVRAAASATTALLGGLLPPAVNETAGVVAERQRRLSQEAFSRAAALCLDAVSRADVPAMLDAGVGMIDATRRGDPGLLPPGARDRRRSVEVSYAILAFLVGAKACAAAEAAQAVDLCGRDCRVIDGSNAWRLRMLVGDRAVVTDNEGRTRLLTLADIAAAEVDGKEVWRRGRKTARSLVQAVSRAATHRGTPTGRCLRHARRAAGISVVQLAESLSRSGVPVEPWCVAAWEEEAGCFPSPDLAVLVAAEVGPAFARLLRVTLRMEAAKAASATGDGVGVDDEEDEEDEEDEDEEEDDEVEVECDDDDEESVGGTGRREGVRAPAALPSGGPLNAWADCHDRAAAALSLFGTTPAADLKILYLCRHAVCAVTGRAVHPADGKPVRVDSGELLRYARQLLLDHALSFGDARVGPAPRLGTPDIDGGSLPPDWFSLLGAGTLARLQRFLDGRNPLFEADSVFNMFGMPPLLTTDQLGGGGVLPDGVILFGRRGEQVAGWMVLPPEGD